MQKIRGGARISVTDVYKVSEDVLEIQQTKPMAKERLPNVWLWNEQTDFKRLQN